MGVVRALWLSHYTPRNLPRVYTVRQLMSTANHCAERGESRTGSDIPKIVSDFMATLRRVRRIFTRTVVSHLVSLKSSSELVNVRSVFLLLQQSLSLLASLPLNLSHSFMQHTQHMPQTQHLKHTNQNQALVKNGVQVSCASM